MKQDVLDRLLPLFLSASLPIWRPIPSRELARKLGVSLQSLANWRVRDTGPEAEAAIRGKGNRTFYRPDKVLSWLCEGEKQPWEFSRDWLKKHSLQIDGEMDKAATQWLMRNVDDVL